jgi:hypothetical protein
MGGPRGGFGGGNIMVRRGDPQGPGMMRPGMMGGPGRMPPRGDQPPPPPPQ